MAPYSAQSDSSYICTRCRRLADGRRCMEQTAVDEWDRTASLNEGASPSSPTHGSSYWTVLVQRECPPLRNVAGNLETADREGSVTAGGHAPSTCRGTRYTTCPSGRNLTKFGRRVLSCVTRWRVRGKARKQKENTASRPKGSNREKLKSNSNGLWGGGGGYIESLLSSHWLVVWRAVQP
jgi:hypothetical protein